MFSPCPKNSSLYTTHGGFGNGSQVRRFVNQSLRVPCEWMQRRMDAAGILTLRAEKAVLCPHPVFSSTSLQKMQQHIWLRFTKSRVTLRSIFQWSVAHASLRQVFASLGRGPKCVDMIPIAAISAVRRRRWPWVWVLERGVRWVCRAIVQDRRQTLLCPAVAHFLQL